MVVLVLVALGLLSSLALFDALQATRGARLAEDEARARAIAISGVEDLLAPPNAPWLCLQPPAAVVRATTLYGARGRVELRWWSLGRGRLRGMVVGLGPYGGQHRRVAHLAPDSLPVDSLILGCPDARGLRPAGPRWLVAHPDG